MKKFLPTVLLSLGVMVMAGGVAVTEASAQTAAATTPATPTVLETSCDYPANNGLRTNTGTDSGAPAGATTPSCWSTATIPAGPAAVAPATDPTTTTNPTTTVAPASPGVQTASVAPIITTTASSGLAFTGADIWQSVLVGLILIGGGLFFVRLAHRRRNSNLS